MTYSNGVAALSTSLENQRLLLSRELPGLRGRDQGAEQEGREPAARSPQYGSQESLNSFQPASSDPGGRQVHQTRLLQEASVLHHVWQELLRPPDITYY